MKQDVTLYRHWPAAHMIVRPTSVEEREAGGTEYTAWYYGDVRAPVSRSLKSAPHRENYTHEDAAHVVCWLNGQTDPLTLADMPKAQEPPQ